MTSGNLLAKAAEMAREGYSRERIMVATGLSRDQVDEILVRVGRRKKR